MPFKVYYIYSFIDQAQVEAIINQIDEGVNNDQFLHFHFGPKNSIMFGEKRSHKASWKIKAKKEMADANLVIFFVSIQSIVKNGSNIVWEINQAKKLGKKVILVNISKPSTIIESNIAEIKERLGSIEFHNYSIEELMCYIKEKISGYDISRALFNKDAKQLTDGEKNILFEQYRIMSQTSEDLTVRRQNMSNFYLSLVTALFALIGGMVAVKIDWAIFSVIVILISAFGIVLSYSWIKALDAYGMVNKSKFNVMNAIEQILPAKMFAEEWHDMSYELNSHKYIPYTKREKDIPVALLVGYSVMLIGSVVATIIIQFRIIG